VCRLSRRGTGSGGSPASPVRSASIGSTPRGNSVYFPTARSMLPERLRRTVPLRPSRPAGAVELSSTRGALGDAINEPVSAAARGPRCRSRHGGQALPTSRLGAQLRGSPPGARLRRRFAGRDRLRSPERRDRAR
jgi:hypothetical protein